MTENHGVGSSILPLATSLFFLHRERFRSVCASARRRLGSVNLALSERASHPNADIHLGRGRESCVKRRGAVPAYGHTGRPAICSLSATCRHFVAEPRGQRCVRLR